MYRVFLMLQSFFTKPIFSLFLCHFSKPSKVTKVSLTFAILETATMITFAFICAGLGAVYALLLHLLRSTQHTMEPPVVGTAVPFISPLTAMYSAGLRYWNMNRNLPIYTLRVPGARLYVVNSTPLIPQIQKHTRVISFAPIMIRLISTMTGLSKEGHEIVSHEPLENHGYSLALARNIHQSLAPGPKLDVLNRYSVKVITESLNRFALGNQPKTVSLYKWIIHEVMMATTEGVYGSCNPYRDPAMVAAWYDFEPGFIPLTLGVAPSLVARKAFKARKILNQLYERYFQDQGHRHPSVPPFTQERARFNQERGISTQDLAKLETAVSIAILGNTLPSTFWLVYRIVSDPVLLEECREELSAAVKNSADGSGYEVDMTCVKTSCPILFSTFQEVFRFHGTGVSARMMMDDFVLDNTYLLKKGGIVLIPATVQHGLESSWGENVDEFQYKRFIREKSAKGKRHNPVSFRGFGGGSTLCPGRHFVATEILAFAALIVMRFNVRPLQGSWKMPTVQNSNIALSIQKPDHDIEVILEPRDDKPWVATFAGSDQPMDIAAEDIEARDGKTAGEAH
ncbi:cytochrome P450 [Xylariomycetidae sp. FL2044]|nr:cytochrome P450 [Xylariomycetidae sp. FL2044]